MEYINKHKKIIIMLLIIIPLIGVGLYILISKEVRKKIYLADEIYKEVHELYYYGEGIDYILDENNNMISLKNDNGIYYKIDYSSFKKKFTKTKLEDVNKYFDIQKVNDEYFIKDFGRGLSNYYGTTFKIKSLTLNRISYIAKSKFCKTESISTYGEGCSNDDYYTINKTFTLVKEDGIWKIDKYTSVFEFSSEEFK